MTALSNTAKTAFNLFVLRELPWSAFDFPRWQSVLLITVIGLLMGLDPFMQVSMPAPLVVLLLFGMMIAWTGLMPVVAFLKWWMRRGTRWDGQGNLFNLVVASCSVANILGAGLLAVGVPMLLTLPLWLYSIWVIANALNGAIPKASLRYSIGGIVLSLIPSILAVALLSGVMVALGLVSPEMMPPPVPMPSI